jgi:hypothetical protein
MSRNLLSKVDTCNAVFGLSINRAVLLNFSICGPQTYNEDHKLCNKFSHRLHNLKYKFLIYLVFLLKKYILTSQIFREVLMKVNFKDIHTDSNDTKGNSGTPVDYY